MLLTFDQHVSVPILSRRWPLPHVRRHAVKDRAGDSEHRRHPLASPLIEGVDVVANCRHRISRVHLSPHSSLLLVSCLVLSLHLVEHVRERRLELERLLDLVRADIRIFAVFKEARAMMVADKLDERRRVGLPVLGKTFEVLEDSDRCQSRRRELPHPQCICRSRCRRCPDTGSRFLH